ncbi:MAG: replication-associated recombination protein A, partial [Verrucomicrobiaceae bacterium]
ARIPLAHATVYIATAPKSNRAYLAIDKAFEDVKNGRTLPVPKRLRSRFKGSKTLGHGEGYQYPHDFEDGFVPQRCLPEGEGAIYYEPTTNGLEGRIKERLDHYRKQWEQGQSDGDGK